MVREIVAHRTPVDVVGEDGSTPLLQGTSRVWYLRLKQGGSVPVGRKISNRSDPSIHFAPIHFFHSLSPLLTFDLVSLRLGTAAARNGYVSVVEELILWGADLNRGDKEGLTPLMWAVQNAHYGTARVLLAHGADLDMYNASRGTAAETFPT